MCELKDGVEIFIQKTIQSGKVERKHEREVKGCKLSVSQSLSKRTSLKSEETECNIQ